MILQEITGLIQESFVFLLFVYFFYFATLDKCRPACRFVVEHEELKSKQTENASATSAVLMYYCKNCTATLIQLVLY